MKRFFFASAMLLLLGAGCTSSKPQPYFPEPQDATPGVNEENCVKSGGTVADDECLCPENYAGDPAGFCLDVQGKPGGSMKSAPVSH